MDTQKHIVSDKIVLKVFLFIVGVIVIGIVYSDYSKKQNEKNDLLRRQVEAQELQVKTQQDQVQATKAQTNQQSRDNASESWQRYYNSLGK